MLRQRCYAWQKPSIATKLVVENPIFCKASLPHDKNIANPIAT
jgi:hypothetical protein